MPDLSQDLSPLMKLAHRRLSDEKAAVRKAALHLLEQLMLLQGKLPEPLRRLPSQQDINAIEAATADSLVRCACVGAQRPYACMRGALGPYACMLRGLKGRMIYMQAWGLNGRMHACVGAQRPYACRRGGSKAVCMQTWGLKGRMHAGVGAHASK